MKNIMSFFKFLVIFLSCFFAFSGFADDNFQAGDQDTFSSQIATANTNGDPSNTITLTASFDNNTITLRPLNSLDNFDFIDKELTIAGMHKIISTTGTLGSYRRGFFVGGGNTSGPATKTVTIQNLTIQGATAKGGASEFGGAGAGLGGGLFIGENTKVVVKNVKFTHCQAIGGNTNGGGTESGGGGLGGDGGKSNNGYGGGGGFIYKGGNGDSLTQAAGGGGSSSFVGQAGGTIPNEGGNGGNNFGNAGGGSGGASEAPGSNGTDGGGGGGSGEPGISGYDGGDGRYGSGGGGGSGLNGDGGDSDFGGGGGACGATSGNGGFAGFGGGGGLGKGLGFGGTGGFGGGGGGAMIGTAVPGNGGFGGGKGVGDPNNFGGAGGAIGGAIFIQELGELTIQDYVYFSDNSLTAGIGGLGGETNGSTYGTDIFMMSDSSLTFDLSQNSTVPNAIESDQGVAGGSTATGGLIKKGVASLSLNGANTYTGNTTIENGKFILNGSIITPVTITGGTLKGNASINPLFLSPLVYNNGGVVAPGNSIGTINITGNYEQTASSTLEIEIDQTGASDLLAVSNNVTLNGTLSVIPASESEFLQQGTEYTIITFGGARAGTLSPAINPDPNIDFDIRYDPQSVVIILNNSILILPTFSNPNAEAVAEYLINCNFTNADLNNVLTSLTTLDSADLRDAILQISPARFGALKFTNFTNDQIVSKVLTDHFRGMYRCNKECEECEIRKNNIACIKPNTIDVWVEPFTYFTHQSISEGLDLRPFKNKVLGTVIGADYNFCNRMNFGGAIGYSYADIDWRGNLGDANINSAYGALYSSWYTYRSFINLSIIGTGNFYDVKRKIRFENIDRTAKNDHKGFDVTAHLGAGHDILMRNNFYFQPTVDVDYTYDYQQSYKEKGADSLNLIVDSTDFSNIRAVGLLNFIKDLKYPCICLSPAVRVGYVYEDELLSGKIKSRLDADSICSTNKFSIKTYHKGHSKGIVGANITGIRYNGFTFYLNYQFEFGKNFHQNLVTIRHEWNF